MGPCQGAVCGPGLTHLLGWPAGSVRPPLFAPSLAEWISEDMGVANLRKPGRGGE
jgi:hypothetical protein